MQNINLTRACARVSTDQPKEQSGKSCEQDTGRAQRRFNIYEQSVKEFVEYFRNCDKLLTVDTSCGKTDVVWEAVRDYICDIEFISAKKTVDVVILFCFSKYYSSDFNGL